MDEVIDIWNEDGTPSGENLLKSEAHKRGLYHPTVHVWCYSRRGEVLLQLRSHDKRTHPGLWDVSVAGHIVSGESAKMGAVREMEEELGISANSQDLIHLGIFRSEEFHSKQFVDREFQHVYLYELNNSITALRLQKEEVADVQWKPFSEYCEETQIPGVRDAYVLRPLHYWRLLESSEIFNI